VSCTDNRDAHACTHETTDNRVRPLPFVGESQGDSFEELSCFKPDQPISGDDKRSWRQDCKYLFFFLRSCVARTLWGSRDRYNLVSVSVTRTSTMTSVPQAQKPQMRRSPRSSSLERDKHWTGDLGSLALVSSAVRLEWIIGLTRTAEGASTFDAKSHSSSLISLCCRITRPPILHSRAWHTSNFTPQPTQCDGRSPGVLV
jgi:hypothetical protein